MTNEELDQLQQSLYQQMIEMPEKLETEIIDISTYVARQLMFSPNRKVQAEFDGKNYSFAYRTVINGFKKFIKMAAISVDEINENTNMPRIFTIESEIDNNLSEQECLRATVAAFLRDVSGDIRAEMLE